jgi:hypothetical protein
MRPAPGAVTAGSRGLGGFPRSHFRAGRRLLYSTSCIAIRHVREIREPLRAMMGDLGNMAIMRSPQAGVPHASL